MMRRPPLSLKTRALRYLSMREHSRLELSRKLSRYAEEGDDIEQLLDTLEAANFQSESRYAESLVNRRVARFGNARIMQELQSQGIAATDIPDEVEGLLANEERRVKEVWERKFGRPPADAMERAKQMRFLQQRGFSHKAIRAALRGERDEEE